MNNDCVRCRCSPFTRALVAAPWSMTLGLKLACTILQSSAEASRHCSPFSRPPSGRSTLGVVWLCVGETVDQLGKLALRPDTGHRPQTRHRC
eukprot:59181-Pyramimonas_sp.AAC.1